MEWIKTFEITKVESFWSWCPDIGNTGIAVVYSIAFLLTLKLVFKFYIFLKKNKQNNIIKELRNLKFPPSSFDKFHNQNNPLYNNPFYDDKHEAWHYEGWNDAIDYSISMIEKKWRR